MRNVRIILFFMNVHFYLNSWYEGGEYCVKLAFHPHYNGYSNSTLSGLACQRWDSQRPHRHQYTGPGLFPDETLDDVAIFCRTPDGNSWPWCFTVSPGFRSEPCNFDEKHCGGGITSGTLLLLVLIPEDRYIPGHLSQYHWC